MRIGIVANEFFDQAVGRMGGFGWIAASAARHLASRGGAFDVEFLGGERPPRGVPERATSHGLPLHFAPRTGRPWTLARDGYDLLLSVDYRPSYDSIVRHFSGTPWIMWVTDPRPPEDWRKIASVSIPGQAGARPQGIDSIDCTGMARLRRTWWRRRQVAYPAPDISLLDKFEGTYGFAAPGPPRLLPYALPLVTATAPKTPRPSVVFLGRLDPIKRPWVFLEVARRMPDVDFIMMGKAHFVPPGAWVPENLPANVRWEGHVEGDTKHRLVASAWALVNTSIHEALPVSFVEAFAVGTPVVSCQEIGGLVGRFGACVGRFDGDGLASVPAFVDALRTLSAARSSELGRDARAWAVETHTGECFESGLLALCAGLGVRT